MANWIPFLLIVCAIGLAWSQAPVCSDLDTTGCQLFLNASATFCATAAGKTTCPRSCGFCPLTCYHCPQTPVNDTKTCTNTKACAQGQQCMVKSLFASDGHIEHLLSCIDRSICDGLGFGFNSIIGKRDLRLHCCHTDLCNVPDVFTTTTTQRPYVTTPTTLPGLHSCHSDIVFVVDESSSVGYVNFHHILTFIKDLVASLDIGIHGDQVSLLLFDDKPYIQWFLHDFTTKAELLNALTYVPYHNGSTNTHLALDFVRSDVFKFANGDRPSANNVVVVITDGRANNHTAAVAAANDLRADGVKVIALGLGTADNTELLQIAGQYNHALKILGYDHLHSAEAKVLQLIC